MEDEYNVNEEENIKFLCFDNFYKNPNAIRNYLLRQNFIYNEKDSIYELELNIDLNKINKIFQNIKGKDISSAKSTFVVSTKTELIMPPITNDTKYEWTAIIFLTPFAKLDAGVKFYKNDLSNDIQLEDEIGNIFNRVFIFKSKYFNSIGSFGKNITNGNLYQKILF